MWYYYGPMPKINLRLTDSEHEALRQWAQESHRSLQREAVYRLFSERSLTEREQTPGPMSEAPGMAETESLGLPTPKPLPSRSVSDRNPDVKTDFK